VFVIVKSRVISQADYERRHPPRHPPKPVVAPQTPKIDPAQASAMEAVKVAVNAVEKMEVLLIEELKHIRKDADITPVYGTDKRLARIEIRYK
jgi:hypothetical protein